MSRYPDAWTAVRSRPWRFLASGWPWRSLAYLVTTVPLGLATAVALFVVLGVGVLSLVVVVGVLVLTAGVPIVSGAVAELERRRLRWVLPGPALPSTGTEASVEGTLLERFRAVRRLPVAWSEVGYAVLLGTLLWLVDGAVLNVVLVAPGVLLLAPVLVQLDRIDLGHWVVDSTGEAFVAAALGVVVLVLAAYVVTVLAVAQAALARLVLDVQRGRLAAAVRELRRSRVDLVDAFETERRRIERDLHDGAQQRLLALTMTLGRAELELDEGTALDLVRQAHGQAEEALEDLRTTVRGIHPRVLVDHGLAAAVHEVADRAPVPVGVDIDLPGRLPAAVEGAAYFVVSEAITNAARHAGARSVDVRARLEGDTLVLVVTDDGGGGAVARPGGGLAGLAVRLEALDGRIDVTSPPGGPTEVRMECPTVDR